MKIRLDVCGKSVTLRTSCMTWPSEIIFAIKVVFAGDTYFVASNVFSLLHMGEI